MRGAAGLVLGALLVAGAAFAFSDGSSPLSAGRGRGQPTAPTGGWTDADVSDTLTCSNLVAGSEVVSDAEVVDTITASNYCALAGCTMTGGAAQAVATVSYGASVAIDFAPTTPTYKSIALTGDITLTTSNLAAGRQAVVRLVGDGSVRAITYPSVDALGSALDTSLAANKTMVCSFFSWSTTDGDVTASCAEQP